MYKICYRILTIFLDASFIVERTKHIHPLTWNLQVLTESFKLVGLFCWNNFIPRCRQQEHFWSRVTSPNASKSSFTIPMVP